MKYFFIFLICSILPVASTNASTQDKVALSVHIFLSSNCPCTSRNLESIEEFLVETKLRQDIKIYLYDVGTTDIARTKSFSRIFKPAVEIINDGDKKVAKQLAAVVTPEVIIKDAQDKIVYQGAIAEENPPEKQKPQNYLSQAMTLLTKGQSVPAHPSWGCHIN